MLCVFSYSERMLVLASYFPKIFVFSAYMVKYVTEKKLTFLCSW